MPETVTVELLLERHRGGNDCEALTLLLSRSERVIRGVVRRHAPRQLPPHLDHDDLVAEARRAALRCADLYCPTYDGSWEGYVAKAATNAIRMLLRSTRTRKRRGPLDGSPAAQHQALNVPDPAPNPREAAEHAELRELLDTIPEPGRTVLQRSYLYGDTDACIAARLGIHRDRVAEHRAAGLAALRPHYES